MLALRQLMAKTSHLLKTSSTIPLISTKRILISHLNSLNTKIPYFGGNPGTIFGQAYKYAGVKSINGIPTLLSSVLNVRG